MTRPRDHTVIVTGATGTLGSEIATGLLRHGARVIAVGRSRARLDSLRERAGVKAVSRLELVELDITDHAAVQMAVRRVAGTFGNPFALVTAAGSYGAVGDVAQTSPAAWRQAIDVNLMGVYNFCHCTLPLMISARAGSIVNIAGGGASGPLEHLSSYGVSKAAIVRLTDSIANEVAKFGIRANAILPGPVDSPMQDQLLSAGDRAGHWYNKIKALRDRGEGGVAPERTCTLIEFLLYGPGARLSGKLLSARYDRFEDWSEGQLRQIEQSALFSLRRLDPLTVADIGRQMDLDGLNR